MYSTVMWKINVYEDVYTNVYIFFNHSIKWLLQQHSQTVTYFFTAKFVQSNLKMF